MKKVFISITFVAVVFFAGIVSAQSESYRLALQSIDSSHFPEVLVNFQAFDSAGQFVEGLTGFTVAENGQPVGEVNLRLDDGQAVTLIFVIDLARYSGNVAISDTLLRQTMLQWLNNGYFRDGVDTVSIVVSGGSFYQQLSTIVLSPTQSAADFRAAVEAINLEAGQSTSSLNAVQDVLTRIAELELDAAAPVSIIYASRIIDSVVNSEATTLAQTIGAQARTLDVPIYVLHTDLDGGYAEPFQALASASGGQYLRYTRQQDTNQILTTLYGQLAASGKSYTATYRSISGAAGERTVTVGTQENIAQPVSGNYQVNIVAPTVVINSPEAGFMLLRTATEETAASDTPVFDLNITPIRFNIIWTDGLPRRLAQAELLVNDSSVGMFNNLVPLVEHPSTEATTTPQPTTEATEVAAQPVAVSETYEVTWDLSTFVAEGNTVQSIEIRIIDELGIQATSAAVEGSLTVELPDVLPTITFLTPINNNTIERIAILDSAGAVTGYGVNEIPLIVGLVWVGETAGDIVSAEIVVDDVVVANFPYPTVTVIESDNQISSGQPQQTQATMQLLWDIRDLTTTGPNLRDVAIQVRNAQGAVAISAPITLNIQVSVPVLQLPTITILSPETNSNISRIAVLHSGDVAEFQDDGSYTVLAAIAWEDGTPKTLVVAELLFNGLPLGTESYPSLLSPEEVGQAANVDPSTRFFRVDWDISGFRTVGSNLGQLQVRVRDVDGFESTSAPITVNVEVEAINPPTVTLLNPINNITITRNGQINRDSSVTTFDVNTVIVDAVVEWSPQLPFVLAGADLLANGTVVTSISPATLEAANQSLVELPDGTHRLTLQIFWDISTIQTAGANLYQLQVRVYSESEIRATSVPTNLNVQVNAPQALPPLVNITSPTNNATLEGNRVAVTAEVLWSDGQVRDLQFIELSVDGVVQQTLLYPQGTRFELAWDANNLASGTSGHQLTVRVRDTLGVEATSPTVNFSIETPITALPTNPATTADDASITEVISANVVTAVCPTTLLEGWDNVDCLRERAVVFLPWIAVAVMGAFLFIRTRRTHLGGITRTLVGVSRSRRPLARLYVVQGPANKVGQNINVYANVTSIGRDARLTDIQLYNEKDESSISTQHCTIRHVRGIFSLMDDNSTNGTQVNGLYINEPVMLNNGDEITLGIPDRMGAMLRFYSQVTNAKEQGTKVEQPAPTTTKLDNGKSTAPTAPVRAQGTRRAKGMDMLDDILTEIEAEKKANDTSEEQ